MSVHNDVTLLLDQITHGDKSAIDRLFPLVYGELRKRAEFQAGGRGRRSPTLQPTALVHEAYLRLIGSSDLHWENRRHFYHIAARAIRRIVIDKARRDHSVKHGGGQRGRIDLDIAEIAIPSSEDVLALDEALDKLEAEDPRRFQVVMLHHFGGRDFKEIAAMMKLDPKTISRDWKAAKLYLMAEMADEPA
jgi:RNA polymerase sigma factor (TIGR02999 family)